MQYICQKRNGLFWKCEIEYLPTVIPGKPAIRDPAIALTTVVVKAFTGRTKTKPCSSVTVQSAANTNATPELTVSKAGKNFFFFF